MSVIIQTERHFEKIILIKKILKFFFPNSEKLYIIENKSIKAQIGNSTFINYMVDTLFRSNLQVYFKLKYA